MERARELLKKVPGLRAGVIWARTFRDRTLRGLRRRWPDRNKKRLRALHNAHKGQRGWVIGNGPSLKQLDLSLLKKEITFGCNGIWLLFDELAWRPTYFSVEDTLVAEDDAETINRLRRMTKIFPLDLQAVLKPDSDSIYVNFVRGNYPHFPQFSKRCDECVYFGGTVSYMMLQLAYWMGCNPIYLIGMDLDYKVPDYADGNVITSRDDDVNHIHPAYFGKGKRWHLPRVDRMQISLGYGCRFIQSQGREVYNATRGGKLQSFPRVTYEDMFKR